jgi:hypothetical protein
VPAAEPRCWSGAASVRACARFTDDETDDDLYEHVLLRYRREDAQGWSASMSLRFAEDLDGDHDGSTFFAFDSIDDTYDATVVARLYHLYANWRNDGATLEEARFGRQDVSAANELFHVDGVRTRWRPTCGTTVSAFGGIPTHLYDTSHGGDLVAGAVLAFSPWCGGNVEVSDVYVEDENLYGRPDANLAAVELRQALGLCGQVTVGYQQIDDDPRRAWGSLDAYVASIDASVRAFARVQILDEKQEVYDLDPYHAIVLDQEPYWETSLSVSKGIGCASTLEAGLHVRRLFDEDDEGTFNHDFTRAWATFGTAPWGRRGVELSVTGEGWWSGDGEDFGAVGFEAAWAPSPCFRGAVGLDYALYRTDLFTETETEDSYEVYVRARRRLSPHWELGGTLRAEFDRYDTYGTIDVSLGYLF